MKIYGKAKTESYFQKLVKSKAMGQFYIFEGPDGVGKKTFADHLAAMIHCESDFAPCGSCPSCIKHKTHNHPDYIRIENDDSEKDKKNISVETIRRYSRDMYVKPLISDTKIYLLDDEKPLAPEGQNAFLKILEEPPSYAIILMLTKNRSSLLDTVLSRGVIITVDPCSHEETVDYIKENFPEASSRAELIAAFSGGVLGNVKSLAEEDGFFSLRNDYYNLLTQFSSDKTAAFGNTLAFILKNKDSINDILNLTVSWLRDVICLKTSDEKHIINFDFKDSISAFAAGITTEKVFKTTEEAENTAKYFTKGNNLELWSVNIFKNLI